MSLIHLHVERLTLTDAIKDMKIKFRISDIQMECRWSISLVI